MSYTLDTRKLALLVRNAVGSRSLREVAAQIGVVSPSTLHRVMAEKTPDMAVFVALCDWLQVAPSVFFRGPSAPESTSRQTEIVNLLLEDSFLTEPLRRVLVAVVNAGYEAGH